MKYFDEITRFVEKIIYGETENDSAVHIIKDKYGYKVNVSFCPLSSQCTQLDRPKPKGLSGPQPGGLSWSIVAS